MKPGKLLSRLFFTTFVFLSNGVYTQADDINSPDTTIKPSIDQLFRFFEIVVFGNEMEPGETTSNLYRWSAPIVYSVKGIPEPAHLDILQQHIKLAAKLTNLPFLAESETSKRVNMTVLFTSSKKMTTIKIGSSTFQVDLNISPSGAAIK